MKSFDEIINEKNENVNEGYSLYDKWKGFGPHDTNEMLLDIMKKLDEIANRQENIIGEKVHDIWKSVGVVKPNRSFPP